ncbi:MAG: tripartite tricarboxylate transporter TctB family protein, partial [Spirochaetales bacterium]|nr:tripartite tricarboxylate transporter TctB family protein [Spirochaetales bacterium]
IMKKLPREIRNDVWGAAFAVFLSLFVLFLSGNIQITKMSLLHSAAVPRFIACMLLGLGVLSLVASALKIKRLHGQDSGFAGNVSKDTVKEHKEQLSFKEKLDRNSDWISMGLLILYGFGMFFFGYIASTAIYLFVQMIVLSTPRTRSWFGITVFTIAVPLVVYFIFTQIFSLALP